MSVGIASGMELLLNAAGSTSGEGGQPGDVTTGEQDFNGLLDQFIEQSADAEVQDQRLEALKASIEDMDESEVVGFLAMLENQAGWQVDQPPVAAGVVDMQVWRELAQARVQDSLAAPSGEEGLRAAAGAALAQAMENYLPAEDSEQAIPENLLKGVPAGRSLFNGEELPQLAAEREASSDQTVPVSRLAAMSQESLMTLSDSKADVAAPVVSRPETPVSQPAVNTPANVQALENQARARQELTVSLRQENWSEAMGQRLVAMLGESRQEAMIRLDPPELGAVGVRLVVEDSAVSVQFNSAVPQVRELLEAQADRLRHALESQGLDLVDVNVGGDGAQGQLADQSSGGQNPFAVDGMEAVDVVETTVAFRADESSGFINTFA